MYGQQENTLWTEAFRPNTLEGYIGNEHIIEKVKIFIANGDVPHLLFYGSAGTGKTTLAKIIANSVDADLMYINASDENSVDAVRDKIKRYASTVGFKRWKIIILDEADYLTPNAQAALRNLMETYSKTTRFILTCNYVEKIIDPIQSRCQTFAIMPPNKTDVAKRLVSVLEEKQVQYDIKDIAAIINASYPDIRRAINTAQSCVIENRLTLDKASAIQANYMTEVLEMLKNAKDKKVAFTNIRQCIADSKVRDFTPMYTFLYDNLDEFAHGHIAPCILIIAESQFKDASVVDKEINIMAMFVNILGEI
jgi:replication factor C small subunit|tara:strand:- start:339 stop:1265 length:927 start_codon:yes stop_codon:yes gene_type:complete